jgi:nitroimidazol reductase NimA-like FMN-containing flavoprotein (pyridoxamine 5'-phosphate oxidase superfamily)
MPKDYATLPKDQVRRRDRAVEDEGWIRTMLHRMPVGVLSTVHEGQPFLNTNLFVYDEAAHCIYMHTARVGRTQANIVAGSPVCFSVSEMGRLLPAAQALSFSVEFAGVTVFGRAAVVAEPEAAEAALQRLLDKYAPHLRPGRDYRPIVAEELARTAVFRIDIEAWSGKQKSVDDDFPGAYRYEEVVNQAPE